MLNVNSKVITCLYTILHFLVDAICALVIYSTLYNTKLDTYVFFIYNIMAFVTQPIVGLLIDKYKNERIFLLFCIIFLMLGVMLMNLPIMSALFLGLGNSLFHISGGKYVITKTNNDLISIGVFVSTGALGLAIGRYFNNLYIWIIFISLLIILSLIILLAKYQNIIIENEKEKCTNINGLPIILICSVVFIRSFVGNIFILDFNKEAWMLVMISAAAMLGKMLGGIIAKIIGINKTIIITMVFSAILLVLFNNNFVLSLIGIILFNCSMPLTLYLINKVLNNYEGFGFGLLAAILFPGYLLSMIGFENIAIYIMIILGSILSIVFVLISNKKLKEV